jgi:hypothetical protein
VGVFLSGEKFSFVVGLGLETFFYRKKRKHFCLWQKQAFGLPTTLSVRSFQTSKNALGATWGFAPYPIRFLKNKALLPYGKSKPAAYRPLCRCVSVAKTFMCGCAAGVVLG